MLIATLMGRVFRHCFAVPGRASRLEYFTFLAYVVVATVALMIVTPYLPVHFPGYGMSLAGMFLGLHVLPMIGVFRRRLKSANERVPAQLVVIWVGLLLGLPAAAEFGVGSLYALASLVFGQLLAIDALRQPEATIEPEAEVEVEAETEAGWSDFVWHQAPVNAARGTDEIYRAYRV